MNKSHYFLYCFIFMISSFVATAQANISGSINAVEQHLLLNIKEAKKQLSSVETAISKQRSAIASELAVLEAAVIKAREETLVIRRVNDERTLSLSTLQARVDEWQEQQDYQVNLINSFLQKKGMSFDKLSTLTLLQKLARLHESDYEINSLLNPGWESEDVIFLDGSVDTSQTLTLGPVAFVLSDRAEISAGLAEYSDNYLRITDVLSDTQAEELQMLHQKGGGLITFDPTLGKARLAQSNKPSLIGYIKQGGIWVLPILLAAIASFVVVLLKTIQIIRLPEIENKQTNSDNLCIYTNRYQQSLVSAANSFSKHDQREDAIFDQLQRIKFTLNKRLTVINVTATVAPLLGLLGTVSGMIETFRMMASMGTSDPEVVSGGIGQALVTTELGLIVAIPSLIFASLLSRKVKRYYERLEQFALDLLNVQLNKVQCDTKVEPLDAR